MATAQMPAPRSARLADDAATAALYATQPRRMASVRDANTADTQYSNQRVSGGAPNLSHASAGAALAHANRKSVEIWRPGRLTDAEKAAWCVKDFTPPELPRPSTQYSAEGLGAAIIAVREQRSLTSPSPTQTGHKRDISTDQGYVYDKARRAATGAYATRQRADSAPSEPMTAGDSPWALSAAGASNRAKVEGEGPLDHLNNAMEASRIHHAANTNVQLYTSAPPVAPEVEERNRRNSLRAAAISMAKDMYDVTGSKGEQMGELDPAILAAQQGQDRLQYRRTISGHEGTTAQRAMTLQDAAQKRAAEKLARMQDDHTELQTYYGTAPQPPRSRLASRRKRTSSDADASQTDAERSRYIRNQMSSLRTKMDQVDEKRTRDRQLLMEAARRNVNATMQDMDKRLYADTGRAPPPIQKEWDAAAQERAQRENEAIEAAGAQGNRVNIGSRQYVDMADVEAVARSRLQPAFDEITDQAELRRAQELEARLDEEERRRQAAIEKEREASLKGAERHEYERHKREGRGLNFLLWRRKSKRKSMKEPQPEEETVAQDLTTQETTTAEEDRTAASDAASTSTKDVAQETPEEPEVAGAATVATAAPISPPVTLPGPSEFDDHPPAMAKSNTTARDAAAVGGTASMHAIHPITSPRADSKLKTWFRDHLARRSSGPVAIYPNQPGPEFTDSEVGFTGGAALTERNETRGAALTSHPVTGDDLDQGHPTHDNTNLEVTKTPTRGSAGSPPLEQNGNGNGNGNSKRSRLRRSILRGFSRSEEEPKTDGFHHNGDSRRGSKAISEPQGRRSSDLQNLRDSAVEQGLPVPPMIGETASIKRESRFSEDL